MTKPTVAGGNMEAGSENAAGAGGQPAGAGSVTGRYAIAMRNLTVTYLPSLSWVSLLIYGRS
jgi:hypothetical protein